MNEKISILVITRNREKMLANCLSSILLQTRIPDEIIVVDNASTDNTREIIFSFKKKLPIIRYVQELQVGIPYARNKGIRETSGTLLLMLDDDCEADKFWVEGMIKAHKKYPNAWVIQGRTFSLPGNRIYNALAEFNRFLSVRNYEKLNLPLKSFSSKYFQREVNLLVCDTKNFSIKNSYLKKFKLSFDEHFYRGSDTDFGRQIVQKNGLIIFCPSIKVAHWERPNLKQFLIQRWHIGRTAARIAYKWKTPAAANRTLQKKLLSVFIFCKLFNQWHKLPIFLVFLFLDRLYYFNGRFFEKRVLSLGEL